MTPPRVILIVVAVITATLLQPTLIRTLPVPYGSPQLVVVVVLAVGLAEGPVVGASAGFGAGLLADLSSLHAVGRLALVLTIAGFVAGLARDRGETALGDFGASFVLTVVAVLSAAVVVADAGVGKVIGEGGIGIGQLLPLVVGAAAYDAIITPLVFPPLRAALKRLDPTIPL